MSIRDEESICMLKRDTFRKGFLVATPSAFQISRASEFSIEVCTVI